MHVVHIFFFSRSASSMVHIKMENFLLQSCLEHEQDQSQILRFYRKYKLKISDQQLMYSELGSVLFFLLSIDSFLHLIDRTPLPVLQPISLMEIDFYKCIYSDDASLAELVIRTSNIFHSLYLSSSWRISAMAGRKIQIELSRKILITLMQHVQSVPFIYSNMMETVYRVNLYCKRFSSVLFSFHFFLSRNDHI